MNINDELLKHVQSCDFEKVKDAIANGADANSTYHDVILPLINYSLLSNIDIIKYLIENGADPTTKNTFYNDVFLQYMLVDGL